ncbi:methyltransferase domain-containing protein [Neorhizobium galegae]|nr:methyltransferase domain-containing protein [Neorhizobium galegae]
MTTLMDHDAMTTVPRRLCPKCGAAAVVDDDQPIWPSNFACLNCGHAPTVCDGVPLYAPELADTISGFDPKSFEMLAEIEDEHFWFVPRNRMLVGLIEKYFPTARNVLEVGCGNGVVLTALARKGAKQHLVGSELHPSGLAVAAQRMGKNAELVQMDARHIMAENAFDVIGAFDVIEHIAEDEAVLRSAHRALRAGGGLVIAVPQHPWLWSTADEIAYHQRRYKRGELEAKLARNGFVVAYSTSYCTTLLPMMIISRVLERRRKKSVGEPTMPDLEAKPPRLVNAILRSILSFEVSTILAGMRYPVGGSRIVVAIRS